jgi:hypothetical protein
VDDAEKLNTTFTFGEKMQIKKTGKLQSEFDKDVINQQNIGFLMQPAQSN